MAGYTSERNVQILISLLKQHGISKIVASPGSTNIGFVESVQYDNYFEVYSSVDERSAAYIACGLAAESGEAVVLTCTGATASRNYFPGLTEAYYRKLPVLAVTASQRLGRTGRMVPQVTDRSVQPKDLVKKSVHLPLVRDAEDEWAVSLSVNEAILEMGRHGGGPSHIDFETEYYNASYEIQDFPPAQRIDRYEAGDELPQIPEGNIAVFVGAHSEWKDSQIESIDRFCEENGAVVLCDQTSNYHGRYAVYPQILCEQSAFDFKLRHIDLLIHIGEISGAYMDIRPSAVWRVSSDGRLSDPFKKLTAVFEMDENAFFSQYSRNEKRSSSVQINRWLSEIEETRRSIGELPFSNLWIASKSQGIVPPGATMHFGILNSLRSWNFFDSPKNCLGYANTGGFGIDGCISSLVGGALARPQSIHFGFIGDLAFFYDLNSLGNRHVPANVRILLVNNGCGAEFLLSSNTAHQFGITAASQYIAAGGHFGQCSPSLVKAYVESLGFDYLSADNKVSFLEASVEFFSGDQRDRPIVLEVFTRPEDEDMALLQIRSCRISASGKMKTIAKSILGNSGVDAVKHVLKRN